VRRITSPTMIVFALLGGFAALLVTLQGSIVAGIVTGLVVLLISLVGIAAALRRAAAEGPADPGRRRFLAFAGLGGLVWVAGGIAIGRAAKVLGRPDAVAPQEEAAMRLGAEYMELVERASMPGRSGELQLLLAPFNSSNYPQESLSLVPRDPRTSHASIWMYLQRIPLVAYGPGIVEPGESTERVSLADLAPTTAQLIGMDWPAQRDGRTLPGLRTTGRTPKIVVTYVVDGGGWNVLQAFPDDWPELRRMMSEGANYRDAIVGSFPAVTACAHATIGTGTFPNHHGITGHNIRDGKDVRKAFREPGSADPSDIMLPTLADLWSDATGNRAWVGEIGYQVWHLGMLGYGGRGRTGDDVPVGVYWDEGTRSWAPHHPELYRLPRSVPSPEQLAAYQERFDDPGWQPQFAPKGRQVDCCSPPIVTYQGDLIVAAFDAEPIGQTGTTDLLYTTHKSPDYTGHLYGMDSPWVGLVLREVDAQLGRLQRMLEERFPGEYVILVTADHGQCPLPDDAGGVRLDPIQLEELIESEFGGLFDAVQSVVPHEVYLHADKLWDAGATVDDVGAFLRDLTYRRNIGPYVPRDAIEQDLLDRKQFAAVFSAEWMGGLHHRDPSGFGTTAYTEEGVDIGLPPAIDR
jgi:hypothetical protein